MRHLLTICAILAVGARLTWAADADYESSIADFRSLLVKLVAADTTNPPGNEARAVTILAARLDEEKIPNEVTEFAPGRKNLVARLSGTAARNRYCSSRTSTSSGRRVNRGRSHLTRSPNGMGFSSAAALVTTSAWP